MILGTLDCSEEVNVESKGGPIVVSDSWANGWSIWQAVCSFRFFGEGETARMFVLSPKEGFILVNGIKGVVAGSILGVRGVLGLKRLNVCGVQGGLTWSVAACRTVGAAEAICRVAHLNSNMMQIMSCMFNTSISDSCLVCVRCCHRAGAQPGRQRQLALGGRRHRGAWQGVQV